MVENEKEITLQDAIGFVKDSIREFKHKLKHSKFDFDSKDPEKGKNFLIHLVETAPSTDQIWIVLEYFADTNIKDNEGKTALHYACKMNKKEMILVLLLFGANPQLVDDEDKKPFDLLPLREDLSHFVERINMIKPFFIQLTRKRRKYLKLIFDEMDQSTKMIDDLKLASFYQVINGDTEEEAIKDAQLFITQAKLFKSEYESKPSLSFEEFVIAISKIVQNHGMKVVDDLISRFKANFNKKLIEEYS